MPVAHSIKSGLPVPVGYGLPLVADAVNCDNAPALYKKPQNAGVKPADMAQLEQPAADGF